HVATSLVPNVDISCKNLSSIISAFARGLVSYEHEICGIRYRYGYSAALSLTIRA
ncbi:hypothetical protein SK128_025067, partial [Halocaridina rubra]